MKTAVIVGANSDIAAGIMPLLKADGYDLTTWMRGGWTASLPLKWDLFISFLGSVEPVQLWPAATWVSTMRSLESNLLTPWNLLWSIWHLRGPSPNVCFFAGSNPQMIMPGYCAYNVGKMALLKLVEQMDAENDAKAFALGPGIVLTKIHQPTVDAGWDNPKLKAALEANKSTPIERIYDALTWCIERDKAVVGGRNICVSDLPTKKQARAHLEEELRRNPEMFKLRRVE